MPFINSKISVALTDAQEQEIKSRLGQAITAIPGKSESWLMVGFEPEYKLYFRGSKDQPMAMVEWVGTSLGACLGREIFRMPSSYLADTSLASTFSPT